MLEYFDFDICHVIKIDRYNFELYGTVSKFARF